MRFLVSFAVWMGAAWAAPLFPTSWSAGTAICVGVDGLNCTYTPPGPDSGFSQVMRPNPMNGNDGVNASYAATAESRPGFWRLGTSIAGTGGGARTAIAGAGLRESLQIATGSLLVIPVRVTGVATVSLSAPSTGSGFSLLGNVVLGFPCGTAHMSNGQLVAGDNCSVQGLVMADNTVVDQIFEYRIPFVAGREFVLDMSATLQSLGPVLTIQPGGSFTGLVSAQIVGAFGHTGVLLPARVYDAAGNLLAGVSVTGGGGFDYLNPPGLPEEEPGEVPEVGTGWMLAAGGLLAATRMRRRY